MSPAVKHDLDRGETECIEFEKAYKGRLAVLAQSPDAGSALAEAVQRYEAIEDLMGRLAPTPGSYMPATPSIRRSPNFMATCRSASPRSRRIFCSSRSSSTASTTPSSNRP